jgi:hypothetical protein
MKKIKKHFILYFGSDQVFPKLFTRVGISFSVLSGLFSVLPFSVFSLFVVKTGLFFVFRFRSGFLKM